MRFSIQLVFVAAVVVGLATGARVAMAEVDDRRVICAGGSEVFVLDLAAAETGTGRKLWSWTADDDADLPAERHKWFRNLDECKPFDGGKRILVCASNSGCGLIDRDGKKLMWSASVTNAHSIEMLPRDRVVVASSLSGDRLVLFDLHGKSPEQPIWKTPLPSAHGLVWDDRRECLWALGYNELRQYVLKDWQTMAPSLEFKGTHRLPDDDGHDLRPVPNSTDLLLTTGKAVWLFDRETGKFRRHPTAGELAKVKAIDVQPTSGRIVYSTWGAKIDLLGPDEVVPTKGNTVYKVRWFPGDDARPSAGGNATIRGRFGDSDIVIATTERLAGAIDSLTWNGKEFIDSVDHGRQLQSAASFDCGTKGPFWAECYNPTEAGSRRDGAGATSSSRLLRIRAAGRELQTTVQPAFWLAPGEESSGRPALNERILSNFLISKRVRIGYKQLPNVLEYEVTFTVPENERHTYGQFEALTGYMPAEFSRFLKFLPDTGTLEPLDEGPGEQKYPVVLATESGSHAMGVFSPDQPSPGYEQAGYGRFRFSAEKVVKWNCVFRVRSTPGITAGEYRYRIFVAIGTLENVRNSLVSLDTDF